MVKPAELPEKAAAIIADNAPAIKLPPHQKHTKYQ
jgi:hypothetical protein